jgi:microcystin-dependent protein
MPAHDHTVPSSANTGSTGGSAPVNNDQPSLALNYLIAVNGIFPPRDSGGSFNETEPVLGQIVEFAGNLAPNGWMLANGQLLPINQNQALFSLLGTQYGGNGITNFALPDLRGRTLLGAGGNFFVGELLGTDTNTLTVANLAAHDHTLPTVAIPEPESYSMLLAGLSLLAWAARRRKQKAA